MRLATLDMRLAFGQNEAMGEPALDISALTPEQRLELIEHLWDSLSPEEVPLTEAQKKELDRRLERLERDGASGSSWDDVERRIRARSQR